MDDDATREAIQLGNDAARIDAYERWDRDFDLSFEQAVSELAYRLDRYLADRKICLNLLAIPEDVFSLPNISKEELKARKDKLIAELDAVRTRLAIGGL